MQIEKRQSERLDLEAQLAQEKMIKPVLTYDEIRFFLEKFRGGDADDITYRMALVDTFINRVDLYDGEDSRIEITCNAFKQKIIRPKGKLERSPLGRLARRFDPNTNVAILPRGFVLIAPFKR